MGHLLLELVERTPKDLPLAIRTFANRTAMLRASGFCHIGEMLTALLMAASLSNAEEIPTLAQCAAEAPALVTEKDATTIGSAIALSVQQPLVPATALRNVVMSHSVLRTMNEQEWFLPMLTTLTVGRNAAEPSRFKRLSSIVVAAPVDGTRTSNANASNEEITFSSVVRLAQSTVPLLLCARCSTMPSVVPKA